MQEESSTTVPELEVKLNLVTKVSSTKEAKAELSDCFHTVHEEV